MYLMTIDDCPGQEWSIGKGPGCTFADYTILAYDSYNCAGYTGSLASLLRCNGETSIFLLELALRCADINETFD